MKKLFAIISLVCLLVLASCSRKDYTCECAGVDGSKKLIQQYDQTMAEARMECDDHDKQLNTLGENEYTDCTIK